MSLTSVLRARWRGRAKWAKLETKAASDLATGVMVCGLVLSLLGAIVAGSNGFLAVLGIVFSINLVWIWRSLK